MDNFFLEALCRELKSQLAGCAIHKVRLAGSRSFALSLKTNPPFSLWISLEAAFPVIFLSEGSPPPSELKPDWLLLLRRHLTGAKIRRVEKIFSDRIVFLSIEPARLSTGRGTMLAVLELIPPVPAMTLYSEDQVVLASTREDPGQTRVNPVRPECFLTEKTLSVENISQELFLAILAERIDSNPARFAANLGSFPSLRGLPPLYLREILASSHQAPVEIWNCLRTLVQKIKEGPYSPRLYQVPASEMKKEGSRDRSREMKESLKIIPTPFPLLLFSKYESSSFSSLNAAARACFEKIQGQRSISRLRGDLQSSLRQLLKKKRKLRENLEKDASHFQNSTLCRKYADLLYALHVKPGPGLRTIQVPDLFDEKGGNLEIPLDPRKSAVQNANAYSRLHQKANRALPQIQDRLQKLQGEILRLEEKMSQLESAESLDELESIRAGKRRSKPEDRPVDQPGKGANRQAKDSPSSRADLTQEIRKTAKVFLSSEGLTLLVGKSSRENDHLTQKIARPEDFWFHVANYGGSHVVLRNPARHSAPSRQSLLEAAQLAAYFSQARNASKVEVHYTQKKHVSKPRGAKPGLVVLKQYKSIAVTPRLLETDLG